MDAAGAEPSPNSAFRDHFSGASREYAAFRPTYPPELYEWLAAQAPSRALAWDCATGSGQAALGLVDHFDHVIATDSSREQLAATTTHERVEYRLALAEESGLPDESVDLITVAQAIHWLELDRFYREAARVLVAGGVLAVWCYVRVHISPAIDALLERFYTVVVAPYWPPERELVEARYETIPFPFDEIRAPPFAIERSITLNELAGYLRTWSATQRFVRDRGIDPVAALERELAPLWARGSPEARLPARWPIFLRAGSRGQNT